MPGSRWMKNGSQGSAIAWATPARRAVRPSRSIVVTSSPRRCGVGRHVLAPPTAQPKRPSGAAATARPMSEAAASSCVGDGDHLEVAAAQREDAVVRADPDVAPAAGGAQPVLAGQAVGRGVEVARGPDDVVDAH